MRKFMLGLAVGSGLLLAQPPAPTYTNLKTHLGITDAQVTALQGVQTSERNASKAISDQIMAKQKALDTALASTNPAAATVGQLMIDIQQLRAKLGTNHTSFHTQAVGVLTSAQQTKLAALQAASDLSPTIHEADSLNLLTHAASSMGGPGFGPRMRMGGPRFAGGDDPGAPVPMRIREH